MGDLIQNHDLILTGLDRTDSGKRDLTHRLFWLVRSGTDFGVPNSREGAGLEVLVECFGSLQWRSWGGLHHVNWKRFGRRDWEGVGWIWRRRLRSFIKGWVFRREAGKRGREKKAENLKRIEGRGGRVLKEGAGKDYYEKKWNLSKTTWQNLLNYLLETIKIHLPPVIYKDFKLVPTVIYFIYIFI